MEQRIKKGGNDEEGGKGGNQEEEGKGGGVRGGA